MGKGIKACARRYKGRHTNRQFGVANYGRRQHFRMKDDLLLFRFGIGDDACAADLGPRTCRRRNGDIGVDRVRIGTCPPVVNILKIPDRAGLAGHESNHLAQVQT